MRRTEESNVDVEFCLVFPHEALSVPVMRRVLGDTLRRLGADEDGVSDLLLAVTEACTNVLKHGTPGPRYEIVARIGRRGCLIQVLNDERGLEPLLVPAPRRPVWDAVHSPVLFRRRAPRASSRPAARRTSRPASRWRGGRRPLTDDQMIAMLPESGRGLAIMRACVDDVTLTTTGGRGTVVSLEKRMAWRDDALLARPAEFGVQQHPEELPGKLTDELSEGQLRNAG
ncbi:MAG TPA: ATP-binding protein [Streptosporangiaceae bacterium]|nr:ATP-binding protein [Streptosporangiaceae bacterium]